MTNTTIDAPLSKLLKAFGHHEEMRRNGADVSSLARSNYELYKARMAAYHANR